jgi:hypothetical protein
MEKPLDAPVCADSGIEQHATLARNQAVPDGHSPRVPRTEQALTVRLQGCLDLGPKVGQNHFTSPKSWS